MSGRGAPGANSRGRGGKFRKFTRGGGKHFSRDLRPLDADGNEISMWSANSKKDEEDDDEEESSEEEDSEDDDNAGPSQQTSELTREERKQAKKAQKEAAIARKNKTVQVGDLPTDSESEEEDDDMPANPNHSKAARNMAKAPLSTNDVEEATEGVKNLTTMSRKERETLEAQQAKERYRKLHEAGKTDEAKADLARLRLIREKRDAEAARKQAEKEEREAQEKARRTEIEAKEAKKREAALGKSAGGKKKATK
ncbi:casein kinase substrate phosphoprotein PP28-domain-containing protein [Daldinia decipiens]|uniref:casein kinase substrate phosphoprotein PP28-domain-containing protein n=1 Tax=Daldinia decipiens TaxID=326647 RepID=UPI0020C2A9FE|nr:casein kinase substrate phosphoprotein PP28-domain-containing protein [Daldinia decipiens]KAI1656104.1 casein kinase substrate phosphoprotein PP28-domain-containing protein [Daldinia decipiens]